MKNLLCVIVVAALFDVGHSFGISFPISSFFDNFFSFSEADSDVDQGNSSSDENLFDVIGDQLYSILNDDSGDFDLFDSLEYSEEEDRPETQVESVLQRPDTVSFPKPITVIVIDSTPFIPANQMIPSTSLEKPPLQLNSGNNTSILFVTPVPMPVVNSTSDAGIPPGNNLINAIPSDSANDQDGEGYIQNTENTTKPISNHSSF